MLVAERITLPGVDDDDNRTLNLLIEQLADRQKRNVLRAEYYDGKRAARTPSRVIPPIYQTLQLVLGWSAKAVDILSRRCNLDGFVWPSGDLASVGYAEVWEDNFFGAESSSAMTSSLLFGPAFLVNTAGGENEPDSLIHVIDAIHATGEWNSRRRRLDNLLSVRRWNDKGNATDLTLYLDGRTITAVFEDGRWQVDQGEHDWHVPAEALVYKYRPGRPFGTSRISRPVMSMHDAALRTVLRMEGHADVYSFPEFWMLGADESIFKNADGSPKPLWQTMLGRIKGIPDDDEAETPRADVKQFPAQSPQPHLDMLKQQAQLFSGETSIPLTSLGVSDMSNPTSADSYIASREDLIAEAEGATDDWAPALRRTMMRALAIQNGLSEVPEGWRTIDAKFRPPVYLSRAAQADAGTKQLAAIPWLAETETGLELIGLTEQQIKSAMADKRRSALSQLVAKLNTPATDTTPATTPAATEEVPAGGVAG